MLENTFCHIPGIGPKTEARLWAAGLDSWQTAVATDPLPVAPARAELLRRHCDEAIAALDAGNVGYFRQHLPAAEQWRMFPAFRDRLAYLDIETTGLGGPDDYITAICLWDGQRLRHYVYDDNLFDFREDVFEYSVLVTYNGKRFDAPFIRNYLGIELPHAHIDLMSVLRSLGYRGGLKSCERQLGIDRRGLADVDGYFAVLLWWDYQLNGNRRALDTLLAYNALDTVNLETLMVTAYNRKLEQTPFVTTHWLPAPDPPELPFEADRATIDRLKAQLAWD